MDDWDQKPSVGGGESSSTPAANDGAKFGFGSSNNDGENKPFGGGGVSRF